MLKFIVLPLFVVFVKEVLGEDTARVCGSGWDVICFQSLTLLNLPSWVRGHGEDYGFLPVTHVRPTGCNSNQEEVLTR